MIKPILKENLQKCFSQIKFYESKDGSLSVNEYTIGSVEFMCEQDYLVQKFTVFALFERGDYENKFLNRKFLNNFEQYFVIEKVEAEKVENKRVKYIFTLTQATCEV